MATMINKSIARDIWPITAHATDPVGGAGSAKKAYGIRVTTAGTVIIHTEGGSGDVTVTMAAGESLDVVVTHLRTGGGATGVFGYSIYTPAS